MRGTISRWKRIINNLKRYETRLQLIEQSIRSLANNSYSELSISDNYKQFLTNKEFTISSQNGEDGLLLFIFSVIGSKSKTFVEFGISTGEQCNTANLSRNFGWGGLLMDGSKPFVKIAKAYYQDFPQVEVKHCFLTKENINQHINAAGIEGEIDLLSIDIDGNDYWIWEAIDSIRPRVVVAEYNPTFGKDKSITIPYNESFERFSYHASGLYYGASVGALTKLANSKGYELIGCDGTGTNCFFVLSTELQTPLQSIEPNQAYNPSIKKNMKMDSDKQLKTIAELPLITV